MIKQKHGKALKKSH